MPRFYCFVRRAVALWLSSTLLASAASAQPIAPGTNGKTDTSNGAATATAPTPWQTDYRLAMELAAQRRSLLVVLFHAPGDEAGWRRLEADVFARPEIAERLRRQVLVRVPLDARLRLGNQDVEIARHAAFKDLAARPGLAIIDLAHEHPALYGQVVGTLPLRRFRLYSVRQMTALVDSALHPNTELAGPPRPKAPAEPQWYSDYLAAMQAATREEKMLLILFCRAADCKLSEQFAMEGLNDPEVVRKLDGMVKARLMLNSTVKIDGRDVEVLKHPAFAEMLGLPGLAILDLKNKKSQHYGEVVSVFPFLGDRVYTAEQTRVIFDLPPGSLTQRTMIFAVRTHPERPASVQGQFDNYLASEAQKHSEHQARIGLQGHHAWESRFHQINSQLGGGMTASEVCAESWPGQNLLQAAIECVRCWRLSSGHWHSVASWQRVYAYDIKRGGNGIWYATGIFGRNQ